MDRLNKDHLKDRLRQASARSNQQLGQHFLIDEKVLTSVLDAGDVQPGETVVEIGPGLGVLTERLLQKGANVIAFEFDPNMVGILHVDFVQEIANGSLKIVAGDALRLLPDELALLDTYKVVANIPYQITTPLIQILLEQPHKPVVASLLVQLELAERLCAPAKEGDRSFLSVLCQYYAEVALVSKVMPQAFFPEPEVTSAVLQVKPKSVRLLPEDQESAFLKYVRMAFQQRRKQLKNVLAGIRGLTHGEIEAKLTALGLPGNVRAQELSEEDWIQLFSSHI